MGLLDSLLGGGEGGGDLGDRVIAMRQQGMDDPTIIQNLQQKGMQMPDIQNALMQADIKMRVAGEGRGPAGGPPSGAPQAPQPPPQPPGQQPPQRPQGQPPQGMPPGQQPPQGQQQMPPQGPQGMPPGQQPPPGQYPEEGYPPEQYPEQGYPEEGYPEEGMPPGGSEMGRGPGPMAPPPEYGPEIMPEDVEDLKTRMDELEESNLKIREELAEVREVVTDLKGKYVHVQEESAVKIEEYSKELESVGAHIKALERVLKRVFSATARNMRELSEIVRSMKNKRIEEPVPSEEYPPEFEEKKSKKKKSGKKSPLVTE